MEQVDLKNHEFEYDIQRFMQIRDQVHTEIMKIGSHVATLEETNKRLLAHFDVFEELSQKAEDKVSTAIKAAAQELTQEGVKVFSPLIGELVREQILHLNRSITKAEQTLDLALKEKQRKPFLYSLFLWLFLISVGFGLGAIFLRTHNLTRSEEFIHKTDILIEKINILSKKENRDKPKKEK